MSRHHHQLRLELFGELSDGRAWRANTDLGTSPLKITLQPLFETAERHFYTPPLIQNGGGLIGLRVMNLMEHMHHMESLRMLNHLSGLSQSIEGLRGEVDRDQDDLLCKPTHRGSLLSLRDRP